ncbi:MAG: glutathione S-transferase family protein [Candidatus Obscuribacterales bacterium]|nr:glutathione S-transferase family protein [Steroidobacteraceae bacterium]
MRFLRVTVLALTALFFLALQTQVQAQAPGAMVGGKSHLVIYHAEARRSERIVWLCEELGIPYELKYRRGDVAGSFADIRQVNPGMGVAPTVIYDGQLLVESGAIIQLILDREGKGRLVPRVKSPDYATHLLFMHFAEGTLAADVVADYRTARATGGKAPREKETDGQRAMRFTNDFLASHKYFGGAEFSTADIMMLFPTSYAIRMNVADALKYPNIVEWQKRVQERPAFKRMIAAARPDGRVSPPPALTVD